MSTARFTRIEGSKWVVATPNITDANTTVSVERKQGQVVSMNLGELIGPHPKFKDMYCYAIDRARGSKAPTSGRMGENTSKQRGQRAKQSPWSLPKPSTLPNSDPVPSVYHKPTPKPIVTTEGARVDMSLYATKTYVSDAIAMEHAYVEAGLSACLDAVQAAQPNVINIVSSSTGAVLKTIEGQHEVLPDLLDNLLAGNHTYLVGPSGSGKTHLAQSAAEAMDRQLAICGAMLTKHEVTGYQDANGTYVTTAAREAYEKGYILLWDEVDASSPAALVAVNAMLSNSLYTFPDKTVSRHSDFIVIAAGNTYGTGADRQYIGRLQLDGATLDRFDFLEVGYDKTLEYKLAVAAYQEQGGTDVDQATSWVQLVGKVRDAVQHLGIQHIVSPRASINGAKKLARGQNRAKIVDQVIWKGIGEDAKKQIKNLVGDVA